VNALRVNGDKFKFWLMGSEQQPNDPQIDRYLHQPSMEKKNDFFNYVNIWMAPTMSEGLHLVPAEAGLTGCPTVATNAPLSGMQDYVFHDQTGYVTSNDLKSFIDGVDIMINNPGMRQRYSQEIINRLHEIGDREKNMKRMVKLIQKLKG
jgi:glycosyltransferase involved in cell wall biosynthesis